MAFWILVKWYYGAMTEHTAPHATYCIVLSFRGTNRRHTKIGVAWAKIGAAWTFVHAAPIFLHTKIGAAIFTTKATGTYIYTKQGLINYVLLCTLNAICIILK